MVDKYINKVIWKDLKLDHKDKYVLKVWTLISVSFETQTYVSRKTSLVRRQLCQTHWKIIVWGSSNKPFLFGSKIPQLKGKGFEF